MVMEPLTFAEQEAIRLAGYLSTFICDEVIADGPTRAQDIAELEIHIHAIQYKIGFQAAARAYPTQLRLLGDIVKPRQKEDEDPLRGGIKMLCRSPCPKSTASVSTAASMVRFALLSRHKKTGFVIYVGKPVMAARIAIYTQAGQETYNMNKKCKQCKKTAVYWNSILKIVMCHACRVPEKGGKSIG